MHQPKDAIYITTCISLKKKLSIFLSILFSLEFTCSLHMWVRTKQRDTQHLPGGVQNRLHKPRVYCTTLSSCSPYSLFNPCGFNWLSSWNVLSLLKAASVDSDCKTEFSCLKPQTETSRTVHVFLRTNTGNARTRCGVNWEASKPQSLYLKPKPPTHSVKDTHITQHKDWGYNFILPTLAWCQSYYSGCFLLI